MNHSEDFGNCYRNRTYTKRILIHLAEGGGGLIQQVEVLIFCGSYL